MKSIASTRNHSATAFCILEFNSRTFVIFLTFDCPSQQEAQLPQRDRAALRVIALNILLSDSRSLKVIRNDTVE